jgi:uncharacterized membrane protein
MNTLGSFLKTTLLGGLLILVPAYFATLLTMKAVAGLIGLLAPITAMLPEELQGLRPFIAIAIIVIVCFALGLAIRTRLGRRAVETFERRVLERLPGFTVVRGVARRISGRSDDAMFQPVLVEIEEALTPAFIVEELPDDLFAVLVPSVPTPAAGSLFILPRARIHWVDATATEAIAVITRWGAGTSNLLKAMH